MKIDCVRSFIDIGSVFSRLSQRAPPKQDQAYTIDAFSP